MLVLGRRTQAKSTVLAVLLAFSLGGCAGGIGSKAPPPTYDLAAATFPHKSRPARGQLVVDEPTALSVLDSEKIVVRPTVGDIAAIGDAQWQDRLPKLVQARVLQSFENASRLRAVGRPADKITADFQLVMDLRAFELSDADSSAVVEIAAKIVRNSNGRIAAARVFRATVPSAGTDGPAAVAAINDAFVKVAAQLVLWAVRVF